MSIYIYIYGKFSFVQAYKIPNWSTLLKIRGGLLLHVEKPPLALNTEIQALAAGIELRIKSYAGYPCSNPNFDDFLTFPWISLDSGQIRSDALDPCRCIRCIGSMDPIHWIDPMHRIHGSNESDGFGESDPGQQFFLGFKDGQENK